MPKNKQQKADILQKIEEKLSKSKAVVFTGDQGLGVKAVETLRKQLKKEGAEYLVAKKTLLKRVTKDVLPSEQLDNINGSLGVAFSYQDEVAAAKILAKFAKDNEALQISGGILEKQYVDIDVIKRLAALPTRDQLLAKFVGSLKSPLSGLVNVLSGNFGSLVRVLSAIKDKKTS